MGYAKPSVTEGHLAGLLGNRLLVDDGGLLHWYDPRNATDSRPWTNSHLTRPLARTLALREGPTWPELYKLAHRLGATPRRSRDALGNWVWVGSPNSDWGFSVQRWRLAPRSAEWRVTAHLARRRDSEVVVRRNLSDATPAAALHWAAQMGILGNIEIRFQNGTRVKTGEVGREQELRL
jgi:hypothetical protein